MSQMLKSSGAMGFATLASRVLGMAREIVYAGFMGDTPVAGAFKAAFMIPNLFRRLLGEGALTAAFIPIFKEKEQTAGEAAMWRSANAVISGLIIAACTLIGIAALIITFLLLGDKYAASGSPGSGWFDERTRLLLELTRLMFPYMLTVCVAAVFMGMLNARGHFFIPAMGAAVLNVILIATALWIAPRVGRTLETQIFALAVAVLVAGAAQAAYQLPILWKEGFRLRWVSPWGNETVRIVVRRMVPGMMGVAAFQLNVLITMAVAVSINPQIFASFDYAVRLMELPQGVFGISLATYLLPTLSGLAAEKKYPEFRATLGQGLTYLAFANLLASVLLLVLAGPIVRLLFERGAFDEDSTRRASLALACLAPGLLAFSTVNILARAFYALGDTKTPMLISSFCLGLNLVIMLWLIQPFQQAGLAAANSITSYVNVWLLFHALRRRLKHLDLDQYRSQLLHMIPAAILAGQIAWLAAQFWQRWVGDQTLAERIGEVFLPMACGTLAYGLALLWMRIPAARDFLDLLRRKLS